MKQKVPGEAGELFGNAAGFDERSRWQGAESERALAERPGVQAQEYLDRAAALGSRVAAAVAGQAVLT
jgi:hypothetical protein